MVAEGEGALEWMEIVRASTLLYRIASLPYSDIEADFMEEIEIQGLPIDEERGSR